MKSRIQGSFVDRSTPTVSAHAAQRFVERCRHVANVTCVVAAAFRRAQPLLPQPWWKEGVTSYWIDRHERALLVARCKAGALVVVTCLGLDSDVELGNPKAAKALARWRRKERKQNGGQV